MSRRSQDIPIRPRYGYNHSPEHLVTNEESLCINPEAAQRITTPASSYTEIPFLAQYVEPVPENMMNDTMPTANKEQSLNENAPNSHDEDDRDSDEENTNSKGSSGGQTRTSKRPNSLYCDSTFPYELEGATSSTGEMRHFVAYNLEEKLREASTQQNDTSERTTPLTSTAPDALTHRFLESRNVPVIDGNVLSDIEFEAQYLAASIDNLIENLASLLHSISSITADNVEVHKNAVNKLTDSMDANIKCMYTIMAKTEEITKSMRPTEQLGIRIREIKRLVDMLDNTM